MTLARSGSYSTQLYKAGTNGDAFTVNVDSGTTVTVNPTANSSPITFLNDAPAGTQSGQSGADATGFTINNNGSLILQTSNHLSAPHTFLQAFIPV